MKEVRHFRSGVFFDPKSRTSQTHFVKIVRQTIYHKNNISSLKIINIRPIPHKDMLYKCCNAIMSGIVTRKCDNKSAQNLIYMSCFEASGFSIHSSGHDQNIPDHSTLLALNW